MGEEARTKKLAEFRTILERYIRETETVLEGLRGLLRFVDDLLLEGGFKRAEIVGPTAIAPLSPEKNESHIPLRTVTGDLLANLYVREDSLRVTLAEEKDFNIHTPPFTAFFMEKVLAKMQEKDREAVGRGEIPPDKILSYSISRDGDLIREITISNVEPDRLREIKSTIRWTLEKMYEKTLRKID